jgi:phage recombination protein Bet
MPEQTIMGWTEAELAKWKSQGDTVVREEDDGTVYKTPEPLFNEDTQDYAGWERAGEKGSPKAFKYYKVRQEDANTATVNPGDMNQPPHGSLADRMKSQEPDPAEDPDRIAEEAYKSLQADEQPPEKTPEGENQWARQAREMRERSEVARGPAREDLISEDNLPEPAFNPGPEPEPEGIQDADFVAVPDEPDEPNLAGLVPGATPKEEKPAKQTKNTRSRAKGSKAQVTREARQIQAPPAEMIYKGPDELTAEIIQRYINPDLTEQEAYEFLMLCKFRRLNPFTKEVYAIKYPGKNGNPGKMEMVVGKDAFTGRAEQHPAFDGYEAGVIIQKKNGDLEYREGTFILKSESLVGGWAKVHRTDLSRPYVAEVALHEYDKGTATWKTIPATMIRKVALVQALREAFPSILGGLYDSAELEKPDAYAQPVWVGGSSAAQGPAALSEGTPA